MAISRAFEGVGIALDSIRANKVRAFLTILGVAIGVMVVIAMASAITGINRSVQKELESLGPKTFFVQRYFQGGLNISDGSDELSPWRKMPWITVDEAKMIAKLPAVQYVVWNENASGPVSYEDTHLKSSNIRGNSANWIYTSGATITQGRNYTEVEEASNAHVVVINDKMADMLFGNRDPIGRQIKVYGIPFNVVGVYVDAAGLFSGTPSPTLSMPHSTFTKVADYWKGWMDIAVTPKEEFTVAEAQDQVTAAMRVRRSLRPDQDNNFALVSQDRLLQSFNSVTRGFFLVMLALSSVGLMVGGVGVVAIMMISVTERTREIGVRKALGATRREIMFQFLVEAATLTLVGGACGLALGAVIAFIIRAATPLPAAIPLWSVILSVAASTVTGIFFGLYPASKASRLDPVEALRYE
ncbi:MAG TPA: ABC transporter permease [Gemmatimonadales bacterium]|nr:ABC transporter permease [Gemmatimonadales bacterium]